MSTTETIFVVSITAHIVVKIMVPSGRVTDFQSKFPAALACDICVFADDPISAIEQMIEQHRPPQVVQT